MAELDGLRAVAILLVISFHSWYFLQYVLPAADEFLIFADSLPWFLGFIRRGDIGVDTFFVLSGFLLSWQLFRQRAQSGQINLKKFYAHRFFRIYPLYLIALLLASIEPGLTANILGNIFAYNIWIDPASILLPWSWSLSVELEFYAFIPLLILLIRNEKSLTIVTVLFLLLSVGWSLWTLAAHPNIATNTLIELKLSGLEDDISVYYKQLYVSMPVRTIQFILGVVAAWLVLNHAKFIANIRPATKAFLIALVPIGAAIPLLNNPFTHLSAAYQPVVYFELLFGRAGFAAAIALMIVLLQTGLVPRLKRLLSSRILEPIARFSFSMYLFHPVFVYLGIMIFIGTDKVTTISIPQFLGVLLVAITGSTIFGAITWYVIERPAIRFGRKPFG